VAVWSLYFCLSDGLILFPFQYLVSAGDVSQWDFRVSTAFSALRAINVPPASGSPPAETPSRVSAAVPTSAAEDNATTDG